MRELKKWEEEWQRREEKKSEESERRGNEKKRKKESRRERKRLRLSEILFVVLQTQTDFSIWHGGTAISTVMEVAYTEHS
jgi:hypothetical protein